MKRKMTELEELANEAVRRGTTYGKYVASLKCQEEKKQKPKKKQKAKKQSEKKESEPVKIQISQPVEHKGKLKNGILMEHLEAWREVRRMFGR